MLVLTRKKSQMIRIGEDVVIKVIQTGRNSVKIGIDAPSDVRVVRGELKLHEQTSSEQPVVREESDDLPTETEPVPVTVTAEEVEFEEAPLRRYLSKTANVA